MALTGSLQSVVSATETKASGLIPSASASLRVDKTVSLENGTGANQADVLWQDQRTLTATSEELDLAGILAGIYGPTLTFAKVKGLYIENTNIATGAVLTVGGAAANAFVNWVGDVTDKIKIGPGGHLQLASPVDGYAVGAGDKLKIDAGAATIIYKIVILGTSA
jgi:hypothetical protein